MSPGGSYGVEVAQIAISAAALGFAVYALRKGDAANARRCRLLLIGFAVFGAIAVLGLASDRTASRTWARLGWLSLIAGFLGAVAVWLPVRRHRAATVTLAVIGLILIGAGTALTVNCDPAIQRSWCNPDFEREQVLAEQIEVVGELERSGRASGSLGPAQVTYFVPQGSTITGITDPPGEWTYQEMPAQAIESERGRYTTDEEEFSDCRVDVKIESVPQGNRQVVQVSCGLTL